jgi:hypothetical protein
MVVVDGVCRPVEDDVMVVEVTADPEGIVVAVAGIVVYAAVAVALEVFWIIVVVGIMLDMALDVDAGLNK